MTATSPLSTSHSPLTTPQDWLPLSEAAELLGIPERTLRHRCQHQWARRGLAELTNDPSPERERRAKPVWYISRKVDRRLSLAPEPQTRDERVRESLLASHPQQRVERAYRKAHWLHEWRTRCERPRIADQTDATIAAEISAEAKHAEGDDFPISARSLQLWWAKWRQIGPDGRVLGVAALVDAYGPSASPPSGGAGEGRSPEAIEYFYAVYHSQNKYSVKTCHQATLLEAERKGWQWPPSYRATAAWLQRNDDLALSCLHRKGITEYSKRYMQHLEIDYTGIQPGERYVCDHHECDFWVLYKGRQIRPWLTGIEDLRSRCIVGWHLGPVPHQDAILAALRMAFRDWAVPRHIHMDRGRDFASRLISGFSRKERIRLRRQHGPGWRKIIAQDMDTLFTGILGELGIQIAEAIPYHPWAKPIERFFGTFAGDNCAKTFGTYAGNSPTNRPECIDIMRADPDVPTLEAARQTVSQSIQLYHGTVHRGSGMDGLSPIAMWGTATSLRCAEDTQLLALMHTRGIYRVGPNGVRFAVGNTAMTYGATSTILRRHAGRDVLITLDPEHCECCYAYTPERESRRYLCRLEANERIPVDTDIDSLREAIRALRHRNKDFARAASEAPKRMRTAAQEVRALHAEQHRRLAATGTYDVRPEANIQPVRTGFEAASIPTRSAVAAPPRPAQQGDISDLFDDDAIPAPQPRRIEDVEDILTPEGDDMLPCTAPPHILDDFV